VAGFFYNLPKNVLKCFRGYNFLWHLLAFILTCIIVISDFDWLYFEATRSPLLQSLLFPAVRLGSRMPIIAPLVLYFIGLVRKQLKAKNTAHALGQAGHLHTPLLLLLWLQRY